MGVMMPPPPCYKDIFTVPWFEKYVVEHWMPDAKPRAKPSNCLII
jgi:hypothetical protein